MTGKRPTYTTTHIPRSTMRPPLETTLQILLRLSLLRAVATSDCHVSSPLGMESRAIQDHQISASSYRGSNTPQKARLNWTGAWRANFNNQDQTTPSVHRSSQGTSESTPELGITVVLRGVLSCG
ncbi:EDIL3 [Branchiostoma lanceolatum]|uniref:EDIL3 protein n=1 Tax=Branchiostoma lanceolatum TaxID=7740 RepID=A0A8K0EXS0_BRALA|nr:EDIL3 [Branchiostoma lanceolatum]